MRLEDFIRTGMRFVAACGLFAAITGEPSWAQPASYDKDALVQEFERYNASVNDGKGYSENESSANLGWGESYILNGYIKMYRSTGDTKWLDRVVEHFDRMIANMSDHNGDRVLSWQTDRYSPSSIRAYVLHNQGTAQITPDEYREFSIGPAHEAVDGEFSVELVARNQYEVRDLLKNRRVHYGAFTSGQPVQGIPGFDVRITGAPVEGDKFRARTQASPPLEYAVHEGMILYPIAQFIELALRVDGLKGRYRAKAESYLRLIEDRVLLKQERYWVDLDPERGAYRATEAAHERYPNRVLPHNQYLALGRAYLVLQAVSDNPLFLTRATKMAGFFKANLQSTGPAYTWSYWDYVESGKAESSSTEDTSHGHIDIEFAVEAYRRGVVFDDADMHRFTRTLTNLMWNGSTSDPTVGGRVDRQTGEGKLIRGWIELAPWDARIWDMHWALFPKLGRPGLDLPHLIHLRAVLDGQDAYLVDPSPGSSQAPAPQATYSLSLDLDPTAGDQSVTTLTGVQNAWSFGVEVHGEGLKDAASIVVTLQYDDTQLTYDSFEGAGIFGDLFAMHSADSAAIMIASDSLSTGLEMDDGTLGKLRFQTGAAISDASVWLSGSSIRRSGQTETLGQGTVARLSALLCDFDGSGDVGFGDFLGLARGYGSFEGAENYDARLDLDTDGLVDFADFLLFARIYGARVAGSG